MRSEFVSRWSGARVPARLAIFALALALIVAVSWAIGSSWGPSISAAA